MSKTGNDLVEKTLEERMKDDITKCMICKNFVKWGYEYRTNKRVRYCTYYQTETRREPIHCGFLGSKVEVELGCGVFSVGVEYYQCRNK